MTDMQEVNSSAGLDAYLAGNTREVTVQGYVRDDGSIVSHEFLVDPSTELPPQMPVAAQPGVAPQQVPAPQPVPAPAQPAISADEYQRALEEADRQAQINLALSRQNLEIQEAVFESSIAHLSEYEKQAERNARYAQQLWDANQGMSQELQQTRAQIEERQQEEAKQQVAVIRMLRAGINLGDPEARADILSAETSEQMNARIALWQRATAAAQQQQQAQVTQAQMQAGAYAAAGQRSASQAAPQIKRGDIMGYLAQKPYTSEAW